MARQQIDFFVPRIADAINGRLTEVLDEFQKLNNRLGSISRHQIDAIVPRVSDAVKEQHSAVLAEIEKLGARLASVEAALAAQSQVESTESITPKITTNTGAEETPKAPAKRKPPPRKKAAQADTSSNGPQEAVVTELSAQQIMSTART